MAAETQYTPNNGVQTISTANSNLDGTTGAYSSTIITGASSGTLIKSITVKATTSTSKGMVRIFAGASGTPCLIREIEIPAITKSATDPAFQITVPVNYLLKPTYILIASTQNADTFNVFVEAQDWSYYSTSVRSETTKYDIYNAGTTISTANSNLDGTGTMGTALASSGCNLMAVSIKAKQTTTKGMVRLFLYNGSSSKLFMEIPVDAVVGSSTAPTFYRRILFENGYVIKTGWQLRASTEKAEGFNVVPESYNWSYPA